MATASHDALERVLFDYSSKYTEPFRLTMKKPLKLLPPFN
jgi:hypothetical protein